MEQRKNQPSPMLPQTATAAILVRGSALKAGPAYKPVPRLNCRQIARAPGRVITGQRESVAGHIKEAIRPGPKTIKLVW